MQMSISYSDPYFELFQKSSYEFAVHWRCEKRLLKIFFKTLTTAILFYIFDAYLTA